MSNPLEINEIWLDRIANAINGLEFGTVQIVVHEGKIVQIEKTERKRFESEASPLRTKDPISVKNKQSNI